MTQSGDPGQVQAWERLRAPSSGWHVGGLMLTRFKETPDQVVLTAAFLHPNDMGNMVRGSRRRFKFPLAEIKPFDVQQMLLLLEGRRHVETGRTYITSRGKVRPKLDRNFKVSLEVLGLHGSLVDMQAFLFQNFPLPMERHFSKQCIIVQKQKEAKDEAVTRTVQRASDYLVGQLHTLIERFHAQWAYQVKQLKSEQVAVIPQLDSVSIG